MIAKTFLSYSHELSRLLSIIDVTTATCGKISLDAGMECAISVILANKTSGRKIIVIGNGGSAAIASHMQNDLCKAVGVRSIVFNEAPLLSALSNDISYANAFEVLVDLWVDEGDTLIAISSSGRSENIIRAADRAKEKCCSVITFSGFKTDNPLRTRGTVNFYIPSEEYGFVELGHSILTHYLSDAAKDHINTSSEK